MAKTAGFCFGVNKAVSAVYKLLNEGRTVCTLGPIIHNPQLVADLEKRGVRIVGSPDDVPPGAMLVIRSHGVPAVGLRPAAGAGGGLSRRDLPFRG